jgi:hypothetical protein
MKVRDIARICHEANAAYCESLGDDSEQHWNLAPLSVQVSAQQGVQSVLKDRFMLPYDLHAKWMERKFRDGWRYGEFKDLNLKTHPCLVSYGRLSREEQLKDKLFLTISKFLICYL